MQNDNGWMFSSQKVKLQILKYVWNVIANSNQKTANGIQNFTQNWKIKYTIKNQSICLNNATIYKKPLENQLKSVTAFKFQ